MIGLADMQPALAETAGFYGVDAAARIDRRRRASLGQFMTPAPIGRFMAGMFSNLSGRVRVLDPGAGAGSLTAAVVDRLCAAAVKPCGVALVCYEIEPLLIDCLERTLDAAVARCEAAGVPVDVEIRRHDFILNHPADPQPGFFNADGHDAEGFTNVIMNPPYRKIHSDSGHRIALRRAGVETSNLYAGFLFLAVQHLRHGGELVAIVPRSFCNGAYFKPFRKRFLSVMSLRRIHLFGARDSAFGGDHVLQENVILHAVKGAPAADVRITTSAGGDFKPDPASGEWTTGDLTQRVADPVQVVRPADPDRVVRIVANDLERRIVDRMACFTTDLADLGLEVSTGPVVDFRVRSDLRGQLAAGAVPLLYAAHFRGGDLDWPATSRPNAIQVTHRTRKWLWSNHGCFVVVRRLTSKEEPRRIVASVYASDLPGDRIGFENHLNVYHAAQRGVARALADGLAVYLNSSLVDRYFRQFSGHTQVNAADLRALRYPSRAALERMGAGIGSVPPSASQVDDIVERELADMAEGENPLRAQRKIDEAAEIIKFLGLPPGQRNERSALTLLALLGLRPSGAWEDASRPLMGITPIMEFCREHYGREYAPNTRETFRRHTMHQFVEAGLAAYNPDEPGRAVNSPKACYQITEEAWRVVRSFGSGAWLPLLKEYLAERPTLAAKWAKHRDMAMTPVRLAENKRIDLTPGAHGVLIKRIIEGFAPRFAPGAELIYVGDTGDKVGYFRAARLSELGVSMDRHGKMPDVVLYFGSRNWLLLVEAVTSHGPVDAKRHAELAALFAGAGPGLVYVTAFPDMTVMGKYLKDISWETEVWCASAPTHLIHFDGGRFLGPYESKRSAR